MNWKTQFRERILERGYNYYLNNLVQKVSENNGELVFEVKVDTRVAMIEELNL